MDDTRGFSTRRVYVSLVLTCVRLLTTLNIPAEFSSMLVVACRTSLLWSVHVTFGLGNHLSAFALMVSL